MINAILSVVASYLVVGIFATVLLLLLASRALFGVIDDAEWADWPAPTGAIICVLAFYFGVLAWALWAPKLLLNLRRRHN